MMLVKNFARPRMDARIVARDLPVKVNLSLLKPS
jgi:hypothetical protein